MKNIKLYYYAIVSIVLSILTTSCERDVNTLPYATNYSTTPELFMDGFSAGMDYAAWGKVTNFSLDYNEKYSGTASMRFEVPNGNDPFGIAAGGVFQVASPRDLTGYNVLTFWAKSTGTDTLSTLGFGNSIIKGIEDATYKVTLNNLVVSSAWTKYYIPIPDASKLKHEKGMFYYWVNPSKGGKGFTFWIDELKFEKLGTIAHALPGNMFSGKDQIMNNIESGDYKLPELTATYNLPSGINQTLSFAASYLTLTSSNPIVAEVNKPGTYSVLRAGSTLITAKLVDINVKGSLLVNSIGAPQLPSASAPTPAVASANVISIYSDAYKNVNIDSYEPFWTWSGGGFTTDFAFYNLSGNNYLRYSNYNDIYKQNKVLVAMSFESTPIDASTMTYLHIDVWVPELSPNLTNKPTLSLEDWSANYGGSNTMGNYNHPSALPTNQWVSLEIPLTSFAGLASKAHLVHLVFDNFPTVIYVDNIYLHK